MSGDNKMVDNNILRAYEYLVPKDRLIIDAMVIALYEKEKKKESIVTDILKEKENR